MEANFFRRLILELECKVRGLRIQKIYEPYAKVYTLKLSSASHLILIQEKNFLFWSSAKPDNPWQPSARVQFLRKRLKQSRILALHSDWPRRRIALELICRGGRQGYLILDLKSGLHFRDGLPDDFVQPVSWPSWEEIASSSAVQDVYNKYPQFGPLLRRLFQDMPADRGRRFLEELRSGLTPSEYFFYQPAEGRVVLSAWPLSGSQVPLKTFPGALQAAEYAGWYLLRKFSNQETQKNRLLSRLKKKIRRRQQLLDDDWHRLQNFFSLLEDAELLKSNLHQLDSRSKQDQVTVQDFSGKSRTIVLDKRLTIVQNMEHMFRLAQKGKRGLRIVEQRRRTLSSLMKEIEKGQIPDQDQLHLFFKGNFSLARHVRSTAQHRPSRDKSAPKQAGRTELTRGVAVHCFHSSDGFRLFRGKNQRANHKLLSQLARPFDLWFHAQGGPGAHVVLKKEFRDQEIPRTSLIEAAVLAANASYLAEGKSGDVVCALVKDLRKIKGGSMGEVIVRNVWQTLRVDIDPGLEKRLLVRPDEHAGVRPGGRGGIK